MATIIQEIPSQFKIDFDKGKSDGWFVYLQTPSIKRYASLDVQYFTRFYEIELDIWS